MLPAEVGRRAWETSNHRDLHRPRPRPWRLDHPACTSSMVLVSVYGNLCLTVCLSPQSETPGRQVCVLIIVKWVFLNE